MPSLMLAGSLPRRCFSSRPTPEQQAHVQHVLNRCFISYPACPHFPFHCIPATGHRASLLRVQRHPQLPGLVRTSQLMLKWRLSSVCFATCGTLHKRTAARSRCGSVVVPALVAFANCDVAALLVALQADLHPLGPVQPGEAGCGRSQAGRLNISHYTLVSLTCCSEWPGRCKEMLDVGTAKRASFGLHFFRCLFQQVGGNASSVWCPPGRQACNI